jgi:hypothetical protein
MDISKALRKYYRLSKFQRRMVYIRAGEPMACVPEVARKKIFLACGIYCCPFFPMTSQPYEDYIHWIQVNWDTSGLEYFVPIRQLSQLHEVARKELKRYMYTRQTISLPFIE